MAPTDGHPGRDDLNLTGVLACILDNAVHVTPGAVVPEEVGHALVHRKPSF